MDVKEKIVSMTQDEAKKTLFNLVCKLAEWSPCANNCCSSADDDDLRCPRFSQCGEQLSCEEEWLELGKS